MTTGYNERKFEALLLYCAWHLLDQHGVGATKLNKLLYFADFAAMRKLGHPITGAEYQRLSHGPAPRRLLPVRAKLLQEGRAVLERRTDSFGYTHKVLVPMARPDTDLFEAEELAVIDEVVAAMDDLNALQVSDLSHREAGWQLVDNGEAIPYELAFLVAPGETRLTRTMRDEVERVHVENIDRLA